MDPNMNSMTDAPNVADNSAGDLTQQVYDQVWNAIQLIADKHANPVQVTPYQIQMSERFDDHGRRYMVLENLPVEKNYVANCINNGGEFAIGGNAGFIRKALDSELSWRTFQDFKNQRPSSVWHVVVFPDSNISNAPRFNFYSGDSPDTHGYPPATTLRPTQQNPQNNQPATFPQQGHQTNQQVMFSQPNPYINQQPTQTQNNSIGGYGRGGSSVAPSQQSRLTTPMPGNFRSGGGSTVSFPQEQFYSQTPQESNFQGFPPNDERAQGNYLGQGNNMMYNQGSGASMGSLPQVHRPIFDKHGYIVGEEGNTNAANLTSGNMNPDNMNTGNMNPGNMYGSNMYDAKMYSGNVYGNKLVGPAQYVPCQGPQQQIHPAQQPQNAETSDPQLAAAAQSFFSFVNDKMDQNEEYQDEGGQDEGDENDCDQSSNQAEVDQDERAQDEGVALGNTSSNNDNSINSQRAAHPKPAPIYLPMDLITASEKEPHRFADNTGMNLCDYCGRDGHEAAACIKWDPDHFDKPVCTACNNDQHSLDECPKFRAMSMLERRALLLDKGARRPGVRSEYHAWSRYARRGADYNGQDDSGGLPLTRLFLRNLSLDEDNGAMLQNVWKVWDYGRGVPDQLRDLRGESLAANPPDVPWDELDERFMGGEHKLGFKMPFPRSVPTAAPNEGQSQLSQKPLPQFRDQAQEEGDETEL